MAGAVAFVFGLCALSFAAGCVVTAIMLRASVAEEETAPPQADPIPLAPQPEQLELRWPDDHFTSKPIHRNPVVSRPTPAALDLADRAEVADRVEVVEEVDELADEVPELQPERLAADGEPVIVPEVRPEGESDGPAGAGELGSTVATEGGPGSVGAAEGELGAAGVVEGEPVVAYPAEAELIEADSAASGEMPAVGAEAARFFLAYAARQNAALQPEGEPAAEAEQATGLAAEVSSGGELDAGAEPFGLASWFTTSNPESAEVQPVEQSAGEPKSVEPVVAPEAEQIVPAVPAPRPQVLPRPVQIREASSRKGKRREIKLELVPQPPDAATAPETENAPKIEPAPVAEQAQAAEVPASVSQPETVFVSRSGLVIEAEVEGSLTQPEASPAQSEPSPAQPGAETTQLSPVQPAPAGLARPGPAELEAGANPAQPDPEAVVPEQGVRPESVSSLPVSSLPVLVPTDEFRRRYLRTFEAARRRSSR
ncbi:MAG: hypothetical protein ABIQ18_06445 [Umezawaea sp.]